MKPTIHHATIRGDAYAVGRGLGEAVRPHMTAVTGASEEFRALDTRWRGSELVRHLLEAARAVFPDYIRELEGMADGAGVDFDTLFVWNCRGDLRYPPGTVSPRVEAAVADGCTTVMLPAGHNPAAPDDALIAHNEDGSEELDGHCFWVRVERDGGIPFSSFLYPGMLPGHTLAINDTGLVQTINNIRAEDLGPGIPRHFISLAVLDCGDIASALAILGRTDRASGFHHALGNAAEGRVVSVEAPASGCRANEVECPVAHANHLVDPELAHVEQQVTRSSAFRQQAANEMTTTGETPEAILFHEGETATTSIHRRPSPEEDDYGFTLATAVFRLGPVGIDWRLHKDVENQDVYRGRVGLSA